MKMNDFRSTVKGLGAFNLGDELKNYINTVFVNYQAKIGKFLTYPQVLQDLKSRLVALFTTSANAQASLMLNEIDAALANQNRYQTQGLDIITVANQVKTDPLIIDALKGKYPQVWELDKIQRLTDFANKVVYVKNALSSFIDIIDRQENTVNDLSNRVKALEGGASGIPTGWLKQVPLGVWIGGGFLGLKLVINMLSRKGK